MSDGAKIGLNEVELGIPVPRYWAQLMARAVPAGVAEKLCLFAQMATAQQALAVGMVDEVVPISQCIPVRRYCYSGILTYQHLPSLFCL